MLAVARRLSHLFLPAVALIAAVAAAADVIISVFVVVSVLYFFIGIPLWCILLSRVALGGVAGVLGKSAPW